MSKKRLCKLARVDFSTYKKILNGQTRALRRSTLDRLDRVLEGRLAPPPPHQPTNRIIAGFHRIAMEELARVMRVSIAAVLAVDFDRQRPKNRTWLKAAQIRRLAMYLVVTELDIGAAELARAIGVSKQNVGQALAQVEDRRDEPRIARLIDRVAARFTGSS